MTATDALRTSDDITDRLLTAAIEVFAERGIEKAGVALIARRAGLTTGAIYSRWEGKQDLLLVALDVVLMQQIAQLLAVGPHASAADVLGSLGAWSDGGALPLTSLLDHASELRPGRHAVQIAASRVLSCALREAPVPVVEALLPCLLELGRFPEQRSTLILLACERLTTERVAAHLRAHAHDRHEARYRHLDVVHAHVIAQPHRLVVTLLRRDREPLDRGRCATGPRAAMESARCQHTYSCVLFRAESGLVCSATHTRWSGALTRPSVFGAERG